MNANTSRQSPAEGEEGAQLLSLTARDLPAGRHQFHKERLMAHIQQERRTQTAAPAKARRFRMPRPSITVPLVAAALAAAIAAPMVMTGGEANPDIASGKVLTTPVGAATTKGVPQLLDRLSRATAGTSHPNVEPGQYIYIESQSAETYLKSVGGHKSLASHELHRRQLWASPDGTKGWLIDPAVNDKPEGETLTLPDELGNTPVADLNAPSYDYLAELPTDPDALLAKIYDETDGRGNSRDQQAFTTIGDLLGESYPPAALHAALFKAAAKIPGVVVVQDAEDAVGRHGVAVARFDESSGRREEWIFDRKTHVYLGQRTVQVRAKNDGDDALFKPGTVISTSAVTGRAVVDGIKRTPSQAG
ncbi:CU044_5270 family protein [Streptomyces sp. NPDC001920]